MVNNTFFIINTGNIGNIADWKINGVLEDFRYMAILQKTTIIAILLISTMVFTE